MVEYLLSSGTKCLDFQAKDEQNCKLGTPVEIPNSSLPPAATHPPPPPFKDIFSTPTKESVPALVSVYETNHYKTLFTVVVNTSTGEPCGWFGMCSSVSDAPTTSATTGIYPSSSWDVRFL